MKQTEWKIIYSSEGKIAERALALLYKEAGQHLIRESGVYRLYVLPCEKEGAEFAKNTILLGLYEDSAEIRKFISADEVPAEGFAVKIAENPADPEEGRVVALTAHKPMELYYAAVHFLDDYIPAKAPLHGSNPMPDLIYDSPLPLYFYSEEADHTTRSIFTWGHPISDYRAYIDNMARMKYNELILWNDYVPLNVRDVMDYAHSFGIRVVLGYAWGWKPNCRGIQELSDDTLLQIKQGIIDTYKNNFEPLGCDGIYFQSFTEMKRSSIGDRNVAETVVKLVNEAANELWSITPDLRLIFGLHATSVREQLDEIAKVDPRIQILWEDCGEFPYHYRPFIKDREKFEANFDFIKKLLNLRDGVGVGLVFKGMMVMDWKKFVSQAGPYVMGENAKTVSEHDTGIRRNSWRIFSASWMESCPDALRMMQFINENKKGEVMMNIAVNGDGGAYLPMALCGEMFRKAPESAGELLKKVASRPYVTLG
ncbi:MAG: hypothetical protein E7580_05880 [Ruminococcaceae bacterium]|nr:hypothetical protein [Oscillospiraceae bacterium]